MSVMLGVVLSRHRMLGWGVYPRLEWVHTMRGENMGADQWRPEKTSTGSIEPKFRPSEHLNPPQTLRWGLPLACLPLSRKGVALMCCEGLGRTRLLHSWSRPWRRTTGLD